MELFASVLLAVQVVTSLGIIVLVLLQQGKGADMGSSFGGGSAGSLFGASGAANFLSRMTKWVAVIFFASTMGLAWVAHHPSGSILDGGIMQGFEREQPAVPAGSEVPGAADVPAAVPGASDSSMSVPEVPSVGGAAQPSAGSDNSATDTESSVPSVPSSEPAAAVPAE